MGKKTVRVFKSNSANIYTTQFIEKIKSIAKYKQIVIDVVDVKSQQDFNKALKGIRGQYIVAEPFDYEYDMMDKRNLDHYVTASTVVGYAMKYAQDRDIKNPVITVFGRGKTVGQPVISTLLGFKEVTLLPVHSNTPFETRKACIDVSDIVIFATGHKMPYIDKYIEDKHVIAVTNEVKNRNVDRAMIGDFSIEIMLEIANSIRKD